jgi:hypothetical protein
LLFFCAAAFVTRMGWTGGADDENVADGGNEKKEPRPRSPSSVGRSPKSLDTERDADNFAFCVPPLDELGSVAEKAPVECSSSAKHMLPERVEGAGRAKEEEEDGALIEPGSSLLSSCSLLPQSKDDLKEEDLTDS